MVTHSYVDFEFNMLINNQFKFWHALDLAGYCFIGRSSLPVLSGMALLLPIRLCIPRNCWLFDLSHYPQNPDPKYHSVPWEIKLKSTLSDKTFKKW